MKTNKIEILKALKATGATHKEAANTLGESVKWVENQCYRRGIESVEKQPDIKLKTPLPPKTFGYLPLSVTDAGDWITFGLVADTHLACKEERLDVLHNAYDLFANEGIENVLHAGNPIDGYVQRINGASVFESTIDGQVGYFVENYPARPGITTHFITGDDHESWFAAGFNIGAYMEMFAKNEGRTDLHYLGHVEADITVNRGKKPTMIKLAHPGGGSAYARSYKGQKIVDALQGGEKPAILVHGHYHVHNYMVERNVHVVSMPGMQDQTIFGRKKGLRFEVGYAVMQFKVNPADGAVTRFRVEFVQFWDRGYHRKYLKSDKKLVKGELVLK